MKYLIRNASVFYDGVFVRGDVLIEDGVVSNVDCKIFPTEDTAVYNMNNCFIFPGLIDVHVHLREPGFSYKETIFSGTMAAAHGGFTSICAMPNLSPVPDCAENMKAETDLIEKYAKVRVFPYGSITAGQKQKQLSDMDGISNCAVAFSDDGVGVQSADIMEKAMIKAKALGKIIAAHCEVDNLLQGGCVHDGEYAKLHGLKGIPSESEWREVERDIELVRRTGCDYHVCHVSTKESVELIRKAKAEGLPVTCETAPHYLVLCDTDMEDDGRFKMNPPLRSREDRAALIDAIKDGTIDMIATDHAPHSKEEKSGGLKNSLNGIVGLETAFPVLYTKLVKSGTITLEKLLELMQVNPSKRFGIGSPIKEGSPADLTVFNLDEEYIVNPDDFLSKGRATPFKGERVFGRCKLTMVGGIPVWKE